MLDQNTADKLQKQCFEASLLPQNVLNWIEKEKLWNLWVPQSYGGMEKSLTAGLKILQSLAKIDGSLGWTVTLCSGANYFIGNLQKESISDIFSFPQNPPCLGGSGGLFGSAKKEGDFYHLSGNWHYATGSSYLSHFTLNAKILHEGELVKNKDGTPKFRSFILPKDKVKIIKNWNTMGLRATVTNSFEVNNEPIHKKYSFTYDHPKLPHSIFKIPFALFADLTLWVNYLGMSEHFLEKANLHLSPSKTENLQVLIHHINQVIFEISNAVEQQITAGQYIEDKFIEKNHNKAVESIRDLSAQIITLYPLLGIKACRIDHPLSYIFRDYFTATQHYLFHQ